MALRRALLYVPASSGKFLTKSRSLKVDSVAYDLEDAVAPAQKADARRTLRDFLTQSRAEGIGEQAVRINAVETGLAQADLEETVSSASLDAVVVPKVNSASDLRFVHDVIEHHRRGGPPLKVIALIESARAVMDLRSICTASSLLDGLIFAAEDFALDVGMTRSPSLSEFLYARSAIVTAARAHGLRDTIDLVCTDYKQQDSLRTECEGGRGMGFTGKQCIHPLQVPMVQELFSPSNEELDWATRVAVAAEKADKQGKGSWGLDGKMIDAPVVGKAKRVRERAERCGFDAKQSWEKWKGVEPE